MLASPMLPGFTPESGRWVAEEKYDGHRLCVSVAETGGDLFGNSCVRAWSRNGIERILPVQVRTAVEALPSGIYDGELLVPGQRSYGTARLDEASKLVLVLFDVLELIGRCTLDFPYEARRAYLCELFGRPRAQTPHLVLAQAAPVESLDQITFLANNVWLRDGEGLIVKKLSSLYLPNKRSRDWLKVKQLRAAELTVVGYREGKMGPHATLVLRDDDGNETTVKWLNYAELDALDAEPERAIGRKLRIEYQERTPDGGYRHPRWDHWVQED